MPTNVATTRGHFCPHIGAHVIDSDQPPGIGSSLIDDIDMQPMTVNAAEATKMSAATPKNARPDARGFATAFKVSVRMKTPARSTTHLNAVRTRRDAATRYP